MRRHMHFLVWGALAGMVLLLSLVVVLVGSRTPSSQPGWALLVLSVFGSVTAVVVVLGVTSPDAGLRLEQATADSGQKRSAVPRDAVAARHTGLVEQVAELQKLTLEVFEAQRRFRRAVGHDLRSPLASIASAAETLSDGGLGELNAEQSETCRLMAESARNLIGQVELLYARDEAFSLSVGVMATFDVVVLARDIVGALRPAADARGLPVDLLSDAEVIVIESDRRAVERIVANLVDNAIKFTDTGRVLVRLDADEARVRIEVTDTGIGIAHDDLPSIGTEFFRSGASRERPGTGIGLAVSRELAEDLGGALTIDSSLGQGTRVSVELPRCVRTA